MAVTPVLLTSGFDTTNKSQYSTAPIAPGPNRALFLAAFAITPDAAGTGTPTLSADVGQTWQLTRQTPDPPIIRTLYVFRSTTGASPSSGPLTLTFGVTLSALLWAVYEVDGADLADPVVQSIDERLTGAITSVNFPFPAPVDPANGALGFVALFAASEITAGAGWTDYPTVLSSAPVASLMPMDAVAAPQNVAASWPTGSNTWAIGVEVKAAAAGGGPVTVAGVTATATVAAAGGAVTATATVAGVTATVTAAAAGGAVTADASVTVAGVTATASASAPAGVASAASTVAGETGTVTAQAAGGILDTGGVSATIAGITATVTTAAGNGAAAATALVAGAAATVSVTAGAGGAVTATATVAGVTATASAAAAGGVAHVSGGTFRYQFWTGGEWLQVVGQVWTGTAWATPKVTVTPAD